MHKSLISSLLKYICAQGTGSTLLGIKHCHINNGDIVIVPERYRPVSKTGQANFIARQSVFFLLSELIEKQGELENSSPRTHIDEGSSVCDQRYQQIMHEIKKIIHVMKGCVIKGSFFCSGDKGGTRKRWRG